VTRSRISIVEFHRFIVLLCAGWLTTALVGCASSDMITFSKDAQRKGINLYNDGQYAEAAGAFRNASRQNPRDYKNYYYLGASYEQMKQNQQAIHAYRTAHELLNRSMAAREDDDFRMRIINGLGRSIARSDQRDLETDAAVEQAESQGGAEKWFILAKVYAFRGDADSAIDAYNRASLLAPQNFLIQRDYGLYLEQIGQPQRAQAPLKKAYALNPDPQVADALRRVGIVPGPSLKPASALAQPPVPKGPIPELELSFLKRTSPEQRTGSATATPGAGAGANRSAEAPRD
jgi:tetratricopeptide (TPR) repeat protein